MRGLGNFYKSSPGKKVILMAQKKTGWDAWREKKEKEAQKKINKTVKKSHKGYFIVIFLSLAIGLAGGFFGASYITRNDCFELNGQKSVQLSVGETLEYTDEGISYVSFGKDLSDSVTVETNMTLQSNGTYTADTSAESEYYIIYHISAGRCKDMTLYRVFKVGA